MLQSKHFKLAFIRFLYDSSNELSVEATSTIATMRGRSTTVDAKSASASTVVERKTQGRREQGGRGRHRDVLLKDMTGKVKARTLLKGEVTAVVKGKVRAKTLKSDVVQPLHRKAGPQVWKNAFTI